MEKHPGLPKEFEESLQKTLGSSFSDFIDSLQKPSPTSIRINPDKLHATNSNAVPWSQFGQYLTERPKFTLDPVFHAGAYYVQEASSMLPVAALFARIWSKLLSPDTLIPGKLNEPPTLIVPATSKLSRINTFPLKIALKQQ